VLWALEREPKERIVRRGGRGVVALGIVVVGHGSRAA
jgi:hypothetical protein